MTEKCAHCGKEIGTREVCYKGIKNGLDFAVHPGCWAAFCVGGVGEK